MIAKRVRAPLLLVPAPSTPVPSPFATTTHPLAPQILQPASPRGTLRRRQTIAGGATSRGTGVEQDLRAWRRLPRHGIERRHGTPGELLLVVCGTGAGVDMVVVEVEGDAHTGRSMAGPAS